MPRKPKKIPPKTPPKKPPKVPYCPKEDAPLTDRQAEFVKQYLIDLNGTQAAIRAGFSPRSAAREAFRMLRYPNVIKALGAERAAREKRTQLTQDMVIEELRRIGFSNKLDYMRITEDGRAVTDLSALTREQAAAISKIKVTERIIPGTEEDEEPVREVYTEVELHPKFPALVKLGQHLGVKFTEHHKHQVSRSLEDILEESWGEKGKDDPA